MELLIVLTALGLLATAHAEHAGAADRPQRFAGHHALFIRRHHEHRDLRVVGGNEAHFVEAARVAVNGLIGA